MTSLTCFKSYDIRGKLGTELNEEIAYRIGRAFSEIIAADTVVVGADCRLSSEGLKQALAQGLMDGGVNVLDMGMTGTEEIYFATSHLKLDGGIEVTASHNPIDYNGMKMVTTDSRPISANNGLLAIKRLAESQAFKPKSAIKGHYQKISVMEQYIQHMLSYINCERLAQQAKPNSIKTKPIKSKSIKLVVNAGNGAAGPVLDNIEAQLHQRHLPIEFIKVHHQADGTFPNGIPNPLLIENRQATSDAVIKHKADMGIAWDGDFDRCFLFDEKGQYVEGYYIVGLLAEAFLRKEPGATIIHDPRLIWNTIDICHDLGGTPIQSQAGHAYIKQLMRQHDGIYGGEMSAHHYFRDFNYCDSGMIPWLLITELLSNNQLTLSQAVAKQIHAYPSSGEINTVIEAPKSAIEHLRRYYKKHAIAIDESDGLSMVLIEPAPTASGSTQSGSTDQTHQWRFNLRNSKTEPLVRLNVESRGNIELMQRKTAEILKLLLG